MTVTEYEEIGDYIIFNYDGNGELPYSNFNNNVKMNLKAKQNESEITSTPIDYNICITYNI